jgi:hypothetical protein
MRSSSIGGVGIEGLDRSEEHVHAHDHPAAAAVRRVVNAAVLAQAELARAAPTDRDSPRFDATCDEARCEESIEEIRKERD